MTQAQLLTHLGLLNPDQQIRWMLNLGALLTIAARNHYEVGTDQAEGMPLRGFNEIQHRVYARIHDLNNEEEWTPESFLNMITGTAAHFKIDTGITWALERSLPAPLNPNEST